MTVIDIFSRRRRDNAPEEKPGTTAIRVRIEVIFPDGSMRPIRIGMSRHLSAKQKAELVASAVEQAILKQL